MADRGMDADLGRGVYDFPSLTMIFAGFDGALAFSTGISSATSMTGLSAIGVPALALSLGVIGDTGVYPVVSPVVTGETSGGTSMACVCVDSVTFLQLELLDAEEEARVASGAGRRFPGIWIWGLAFRSFCLGISGRALTTESMVFTASFAIGRSLSFRARVRSSRSLRK